MIHSNCYITHLFFLNTPMYQQINWRASFSSFGLFVTEDSDFFLVIHMKNLIPKETKNWKFCRKSKRKTGAAAFVAPALNSSEGVALCLILQCKHLASLFVGKWLNINTWLVGLIAGNLEKILQLGLYLSKTLCKWPRTLCKKTLCECLASRGGGIKYY